VSPNIVDASFQALIDSVVYKLLREGASAAGYAALSLFALGTGILTTEFKINFLAPARGERLIARGRAIKSGRTLTVCRSDVAAVRDGAETLIATGLFTLMQVEGLED
jgi:acyl-coenzyme A thioesterase PaaI-like protein